MRGVGVAVNLVDRYLCCRWVHAYGMGPCLTDGLPDMYFLGG